MSDFPYDEAFSRNLGWVAPWEQQALRAKRVAIAGMGGVGGVHLLTLARFGVGGASIADLDRFEFLAKPFHLDELLHKVRALLDSAVPLQGRRSWCCD